MADSGPIVVLEESGALEAILNIPEATPAPARVGYLVRLHAEGLAEPLESRIQRVNPRVDAETRIDDSVSTSFAWGVARSIGSVDLTGSVAKDLSPSDLFVTLDLRVRL